MAMTPIQIKERVRDDMDQYALSLPADRDFEHNRFHDYFRQIPFARMQEMLCEAGIDLNGKHIHLAGCGAGIDLYHLSRMYGAAKFFVSDISPQAVSTTLRTFPGVDGRAEDLERLSFPDDSFDWSFISAAIHHLPRPALGVYELLRVSREGLIFIEPHDSWLVRSFVSMGLAQEYEEVGNYVYRWSEHDVKKLCRSLYYKYRCATLFATHRVATTRLEFEALRGLNSLANKMISGSGNYIVACIQKNPSGAREVQCH
jgi:ubiquinone/menaquinone biosynthesis C-methylase UbiE